MEIRKIIKELISDALDDLGVEFLEDIQLEHPDELAHGDYSCNVAMVLGKRELAQQVVDEIPEHKYIEKVEVAGPGFINFFLSKQFYTDFLNNDVESLDILGGKKILLEHSSPNLFKPFHVGHLVNNSIGESLGRILSFAGAQVEQVSYPSDVSPGIAKTVWAIGEQKLDIEKLTLQQIAEAYVLGTREYEESEKAKKVIDKINENIYEGKKDENFNVYLKGRNLSLDSFAEITEKLGSKFSDLIFESESEKAGKEIVKDNTPGVFKESDGAIIFEGSQYGLFDNVFINSVGYGTYLAKDIGLIKIKFDKYDFDQSLTITDVEQRQHFQLVKKAAELIDSEWAEKSLYLQHGRMSFSGNVKISSRYGNVPLVTDIFKQLDKKIENDLPTESRQKIAVAALKYKILKASAGRNIVFDIEQALDFTGNSGPYLQYAYVRASSILNKAKAPKSSLETKEGEIVDLEKYLYRFSEETRKSLLDYSPHHLANYLYDLASEFNSFYEKTQVLDEKNPDYFYNLALVKKFSEVLKEGLFLLGIETVEKM